MLQKRRNNFVTAVCIYWVYAVHLSQTRCALGEYKVDREGPYDRSRHQPGMGDPRKQRSKTLAHNILDDAFMYFVCLVAFKTCKAATM